MVTEVHITPRGMLRDEGDTFLYGNGYGILALTQEPDSKDTPAGRLYFKDLFIDRIRKIVREHDEKDERPQLSALFDKTRPTEEECRFNVLSAPPFLGIEYFDADLLYRMHLEFEQELAKQFLVFQGSFTEYVRGIAPAWKNVGKVSFHLAENKGATAQDYPFAFMASFIYHADAEKPKHLPLAHALKIYAGDSVSMRAVLAPIQQVASQSEFIREMLEQRRIFQPSLWTSQQAYAFLKEIKLYEDANIVVRVVNLWKTTLQKAQVSVGLDVAKGSKVGAESLLDFSVGVTLGGEKLTPEEVQQILSSEGGLVRVKGEWVEVNPDKLAELLGQWKDAEQLAKSDGISMAKGLRLLAGLDGLTDTDDADGETNCTFEAMGKLKAMLAEFTNPNGIPMPPLSDYLSNTLRPYQADGVKYLWRTAAFGLGTCLADDMGLGKTLQMLSLIDLWKSEGKLDNLPALLILPATLLANWRSESQKFTPHLKLLTLHSSSLSKPEWVKFKANPQKVLKSYDVALITYGMLMRLPELAELDFPAVVADEAQAIKNPTSKQSRAVRNLKSSTRIALTGTPVENRLSDLWSIFDFINPGLLGGLKPFMEYIKGIESDYSSLRKLTQPFILRRLKTDKRIITDLPDKTELKAYCSLTKKQAVLYAKNVEEMKYLLEKETDNFKRRGVVITYLMRFKQICNHATHFLGGEDYPIEGSGKFKTIEGLVESIASRQEKVLVFTQFREMTQPLHDFLETCFGRKGLILHGGTPVKERPKLVKQFQDDDGPPFFVLSLKAAGVGLNLTAANHVIHFDRWWNPAVENQASDRAFRIGQKRNVLVHKFICKGTLEEKIDEMLTEKQNLADEILSEGAEKLLTSMTTDELINLVKLDTAIMES